MRNKKLLKHSETLIVTIEEKKKPDGNEVFKRMFKKLLDNIYPDVLNIIFEYLKQPYYKALKTPAYCMKCRTQVILKNAEITYMLFHGTNTRRKTLAGQCPECSSRVNRFVKTGKPTKRELTRILKRKKYLEDCEQAKRTRSDI